MNRLFTPAPPLAALVRCFWYWEGIPQPHLRERLLPNGEAAIIFNLRDDEMRIYDADDPQRYTSCGLVGITGPRTNCFAIDTAAEERVIGIQFQAGGTFPFFREPAAEVANQSVALDCLWGPRAALLREQLLAAASPEAMFALLESELLAHLARPLELHPAVAFARGHICRAPHATTIAGVTQRIGMSQRRFIEIFRDQIGLAPKAFCRVRRFQRVLEAVHRRQSVDWVQVALDGGYYDQAHFIHDFQDFSGMTPAAYLAKATEHLNHVPIS
ncbi:MAG: helix-turn-helix domain-containing protein [Acidobacteriaceae bacterium]